MRAVAFGPELGRARGRHLAHRDVLVDEVLEHQRFSSRKWMVVRQGHDAGFLGDRHVVDAGPVGQRAQDRHVRLALAQRRHRVLGLVDADVDLRVFRPPLAQERRGAAAERGPGEGEPKWLRGRGFGQCGVERGEDAVAVLPQAVAGFGQRDVTGRAVDELDADAAFELFERAGQRRLGDVQRPGRRGDRQVVADRGERPQVTQLDIHNRRV
ncbi:hypothetical protein Lesp01_09040 [Lentzea sp. NBRC 102530]|nr:hypothetical protein Lesp01_09040 [Lentzea sp. NBRC 102530]